MWLLYEIAFVAGFILYLPYALWRKRLPHPLWTMRLGRYPKQLLAKLEGRSTIWVHAVSVGEVLSARPLIEALSKAYPYDLIVLSTVTSSGFGVASKQFKDRAVVIYFPLDLRWCVKRAFDVVHPRILLLVESELWPLVIDESVLRGIPVVVVNGRISERAFYRYRRAKRLLHGMLSRVNVYLMQSQLDANRLIQLGVCSERVRVVGNLKWDASRTLDVSAEIIQETYKQLGLDVKDYVFVAGSTHHGEEAIVLESFLSLRLAYPKLRLIIAPRHLERLSEVEAIIRQAGLASRRLSNAAVGSSWDVGIVDTFGQLARYYCVASVVFIGGSLVPHGGQNPLEAASLGRPIVFGPFMHNFEAIAHQLLAHHAARQASQAEELSGLLRELFDDCASAQMMGKRAQELTAQFQGATQRTIDVLEPLLLRK